MSVSASQRACCDSVQPSSSQSMRATSGLARAQIISPGAVLILQATFADEQRAAGFWLKAAELFERLAVAPGFIRRFSFFDGPHGYLIAFWRTTADAHAFFSSDEHQAAMRELYRQRWQYSHFAALWEMTTPHQRVIFCQQCAGVTPATDGFCVGCGTELFDPFAIPSHAEV